MSRSLFPPSLALALAVALALVLALKLSVLLVSGLTLTVPIARQRLQWAADTAEVPLPGLDPNPIAGLRQLVRLSAQGRGHTWTQR